MRINAGTETKKMVLTALFACLAYVLNTFVYFPAMAPFQHFVDVLAAVFVGPWYGFAAALICGCMRMMSGRTIQAVTGAISENDQADRRIGSGDQDKDHHMVDLPENLVYMLGNIKGMVDGAGRVKKDHADDKNRKGRYVQHSRYAGRLDKQGHRRQAG